MSTKETEMLENKFKEYTESGPIDNAIVELENNFQVRDLKLAANNKWLIQFVSQFVWLL